MNTPPIVAVASDAGDLEAVCELLSALPAECDVAFIVVQHLDAAREKLLRGHARQANEAPGAARTGRRAARGCATST